MAFCTNCGQRADDGTKFCANCGTPMVQTASGNTGEEKIFYDGEMRKCRACGEPLRAFVSICPSCGLELRGTKGCSAVTELVRKIEELDEKRGDNSFIESVKRRFNGSKLSPIEEQKISLISNFPIPNTKEDILEFMILSSSHILTKQPSDDVSERDKLLYTELKKAWEMKFEQAYDKAKICIKNDEDRTEIEQCYNKTIVEPKKKRKKTTKIVLLSVFIPLFLIIAGILITKLVDDSTAVAKWDEIILNVYAPQPPMTSAVVMTNSREEFCLHDIKCSQSEFYDYVNDCKEFGYDYEVMEEDEYSYVAYNEDGYKINVSYITTLTVELNIPMSMDAIQWPNSDIAKLIPQPDSLKGKVEWEHDYGFAIYIADITKAEYSDYVNSVYNCGFNIDYSKGDTYFWADNADGCQVEVRYKGYNTMWIRLDEPSEN